MMFLQLKSLRYSILIIGLLILNNAHCQHVDSVFIGEVKKGKKTYASCYLLNQTELIIQFKDVLHGNKEVSFSIDNNEFKVLYDDILIGLVQKPQFDVIKKI